MQHSSDEFYSRVESGLAAHQLKDAKLERVNLAEGGILSAKRQYLQVKRGDYVFHICAAPFGDGFFVSWWLGLVEGGFFHLLASIPFIGILFRWLINKHLTYYKVDTALMFQSITHDTVLDALDSVMNGKGMQALSGEQEARDAQSLRAARPVDEE
jgi:hypothetical protein